MKPTRWHVRLLVAVLILVAIDACEASGRSPVFARVLSTRAAVTRRALSPRRTAPHAASDPARPDLVWMRGDDASFVNSAVPSPDGKYVASGSDDFTVKLWRSADGMLLRTFETAGNVTHVIFSHDGQLIAASDNAGEVQFWRLDGTSVGVVTGFTGAVLAMDLSPDGSVLATGSDDHLVQLWRVPSGALITTLRGHTGAVSSVAFVPASSGALLASASGVNADQTIRLWSVKDGTLAGALTGPAGGHPYHVGFSPDGAKLVVGTDQGDFIEVLRVSDGTVVQAFAPQYPLADLSVAPLGDTVALAEVSCSPYGCGAEGEVWRYTDGTLLQRFAQTGTVGLSRVSFWPDGQSVLTAGGDTGDFDPGIIRYGVSDGSVLTDFTAPGPGGPVSALAVSVDGSLVASSNFPHGHVIVRRASDGSVSLHIPEDGPAGLAFAPDGKLLAGYDSGGSVWLRSTADGSLVREAHVGVQAGIGVSFSPDGQYLAIGANPIRVFRVSDLSLATTLPGYTIATFSPDGQELVELGSGGLLVHRVSDWSVTETIATDLGNNVQSLAISPDGKRIAAAGSTADGGVVEVWDVASAAQVGKIQAAAPFSSVAFSPDGTALATGNLDAKLQIWDATGSTLLTTYTQEVGTRYLPHLNTGGVTGLVYTADGKSLVYGRDDGTVAEALSPQRALVSPDRGGNTGDVTVTIVAPDSLALAGGADVKLSALGQPDVLGAGTTVSGQVLTTTFHLAGAPTGSRNVVITPIAGPSITYPAAFTVEQGTTAELSVDVTGSTAVRLGASQAYSIQVTNNGNTDAPACELRVELSSFAGWNLDGGGVPITTERYPNYTIGIVSVPPTHALSKWTFLLNLKVTDPVYVDKPLAVFAWINETKDRILLFGDGSDELLMRSQLTDGTIVNYYGSLSSDASSVAVTSIVAQAVDGGLTSLQFDHEERLVALQIPAVGVAIQVAWGSSGGTATVTLHHEQRQVSIDLPIPSDLAQLAPSSRSQCGCPRTRPPRQRLPHSGPYPDDRFLLCTQLNELLGFGCNHAVPIALSLGSKVLVPELTSEKVIKYVAKALGLGAVAQYFMKQIADKISEKTDELGRALCRRSVAGQLADLLAGACFDYWAAFPRVVRSVDPNDLLGPLGSGDPGWVPLWQPLAYELEFENESAASASARDVVVEDRLDPNVFDLTSVRIGSIALGDKIATPAIERSSPAGLRSFSADLPSNGLIARITASLDMLTGDLVWTLTSIDPQTGKPPADPLAGFLAPGTGGSVLFSVTPRPGLPTGTIIQNRGTVWFDGVPLDTPAPGWTNTIDNLPPTSAVTALGAAQHCGGFNVEWSGTDSGSGVGSYTVYVSDNGGPYKPWLTNTTVTGAVFTGVGGHTYAFYTTASDAVFNVEPPHATPDAVTTVDAAVGDVQDVTSLLKIAHGKPSGGPKAKRATQAVTLKNTGNQPIAGPISLVLDSLSGNAKLPKVSGTTSCLAPSGSPYVNLSAHTLRAHGKATVTLHFNRSAPGDILYVPRVLAGVGNR